jgi:rubrerythrin
MTVATATPAALSEQQLNLLLQYTIEAYKGFEKLAEQVPNPLAAQMFKQFAVDERGHRDLIEMKFLANSAQRVRVTLGADLLFEDILRGSLSDRETAEYLIARERTMAKKLTELSAGTSTVDRGLLIYLAAGKRAHIVELERELELIKIDAGWFDCEDAESRLVHGMRTS